MFILQALPVTTVKSLLVFVGIFIVLGLILLYATRGKFK